MPVPADFHDVRFPTNISFGSSGGPQRRTEIVTIGSGREHRNQRWANSRRRYDAGYGVKDLDTLHEVVAFFEARRGSLHGFRFRDPLDWKSRSPLGETDAQDQKIGEGDGVATKFQLIKSYGEGEAAYNRRIELPVEGTIALAIDGSVVPQNGYSLDAGNGEITFEASNIPSAGASITAGFEFDVPVRFASDELTVSLAAFIAGDMPSIPLVEIVR